MEYVLENNYFKKLLNKIGYDFVLELRKELKAQNKDASGKLAGSLNYKLVQKGKDWYIEIISEDYLKFVDEGRKPGKMPPISKIKPWVISRGIKMTSSGKLVTTESAAYVIAKSIGKKGIKPTHIISKVNKLIFSQYEAQIRIAVKQDYEEYIKNVFSTI